MKRILLVGLLALGTISTASAQCNGVFPNNTVCGNVTGSGNLPRPTSPSAFLGAAGGTNGQIQYNNSGALGGFGPITGDISLTVPGAVSTIQPNAITTTKIIDGAITSAKILNNTILNADLAANAIPVLPSRATAATLDLSAYTAVRTLGYTVGGDGGGATFQKIAGNFVDTRILTGTISGNGTSGCTNGTYRNVQLAGGSGRGAVATVVVAGNVITTVTVGTASTAGYAASDVLTISSSVPGCAGAKTWTVSTVTTPTGSFTDSAGNKWQINYPAEGLDARSMGVKFDWDGTDGLATDNATTLQNALSFAGYPTSTIVDLGGAIGGQVNLVKGSAMFGCGSSTALVLPYGVKLKGQGNYVSVLKVCDTFNVNNDIVVLCDRETQASCFDSILEDLQIFVQRDIVGAATRSVVYTNNAQHESGVRRVVIYTGACGRGLTYESGFGGTTYILLDSTEFKGGKGSASCGGVPSAQIFINMGTTQVLVHNLNVSGLSASFSGPRNTGLAITGGFVDIVGIHTEQVIDPVIIAIPTSLANGQVRARSVIGGVDCVGMFQLTSTNTPGNFNLGPPNALNGCTRLVTNAQPAGSNLTGPVLIDTIFNP